MEPVNLIKHADLEKTMQIKQMICKNSEFEGIL